MTFLNPPFWIQWSHMTILQITWPDWHITHMIYNLYDYMTYESINICVSFQSCLIFDLYVFDILVEVSCRHTNDAYRNDLHLQNKVCHICAIYVSNGTYIAWKHMTYKRIYKTAQLLMCNLYVTFKWHTSIFIGESI